MCNFNMAISPSACLLLTFGVLTSCSWPPLETYALYDWCNSTIEIPRAVTLQAKRQAVNVSAECVVRIQASTKHQFSISYDLSDRDVMVIFCQNSIEIFFKSYLNNDTDCQSFPESLPLLTLSDALTLSLHDDVTWQDYVTEHDVTETELNGNIRLLVVPFHTGDCTDNEFRCANDRCVDSQLRCHPEYFTCASEDCSNSGTTGAIIVAVIVVGAIVIIICIIGCSCCCFLIYKKRKKRSRQRRYSAELRAIANHQHSLANTTVLTTPPYSPPSDPPPYSLHPEENGQLSLQIENGDKEREVTPNTDPEREVTMDAINSSEVSGVPSDNANEFTPNDDKDRGITSDAHMESELPPVGMYLSTRL